MKMKLHTHVLAVVAMSLAGATTVIHALGSVGNPVPEIDGSSLSAGLAVAAAAVVMLRARLRSK